MRYLPLRLKSDITNETIARSGIPLKLHNIDIRPIRE